MFNFLRRKDHASIELAKATLKNGTAEIEHKGSQVLISIRPVARPVAHEGFKGLLDALNIEHYCSYSENDGGLFQFIVSKADFNKHIAPLMGRDKLP